MKVVSKGNIIPEQNLKQVITKQEYEALCKKEKRKYTPIGIDTYALRDSIPY